MKLYFYLKKEQTGLKEKNNNIIAGFELSSNSKYWNDNTTEAYYIYKIVTKVDYKKLGVLIFMISKNICKNNNKIFLRLDCLNGNNKLNKIYEDYGFKLKYTGCCDYYNYLYKIFDILF